MKKKLILKRFLSVIIITAIIPCTVYASSPQLSTDSVGRFEYDADSDGTTDVILDSGDVNKLTQAENTNASDIETLQSKYTSLVTSLDAANAKLADLSTVGTATAANIDSGMTAVVKGQVITGTKAATSSKRVSKIYVSSHSTWGGGSNGTTLTVSINYNADGTVASVTGSTSYQDDGTTSLNASGYSY